MNALLLLVPLLAVTNGPSGYKHVGGADGVEVYRQMSSQVIDLVAEGDIDAPPSAVRAVVLDYVNAAALSPRVVESRILAVAPRELVVYQRLKLPVIADRDFTLRAKWGSRQDRLWTRFVIDNQPGPEARGGVVRLSTMTGGWDLTPIRDGQATHAVYHLQIDLAGSIPRWMVSGGAAKDLPRLFQGVRSESRKRASQMNLASCRDEC
jgi:hypothetical protein